MPHEPRRGDAIDSELDREAGRFWQSAVRRLALEINIGWWLSTWLPLAAAIGLVGMVAMLYARWRAADAAAWVWAGIAATLAAAGAVAWWRARERFESTAAARVRLEEALGLKARLTAATAGVGAWPGPVPRQAMAWPVSWKWQRPAAVVGCLAALLVVAWRVPMAGAGAVRKHVIEKPTDARMVEQWIDELRREEIIDERSADEVGRKIKELTERPAEEWYEHASLEAAGTLKEQTAAQLREMAENAAAAAKAAAGLQSLEASLPAPLREALAKELAAAIQALELGELKPAGDLAKLLAELAPADLGQLAPEQFAALAKRLAANRQALREALANCEGFDLDDLEGRPGRGGIDRGRGDAELTFGEKNELGTKRTEKIEKPVDVERAAPDEVLAVVDGEHEIDETAYAGPRAGGGIASEGDGGSAVQVDSLLPAEQSAVKRFFQ
jgi:hypothetical protein